VRSDELRQILRRRWRIPVLLMTAAVLVAGLQNLASKPKYTASAAVVARNALTILKPLKFEEVAVSSSVVAHVVQQLHLSESTQDLARQIKATAGQSAMYRVSVTDPDPNRAVSIVNAVSLEAARVYTELAVGTPVTTATQVELERASYREGYLAAAQKLLDFEAVHPDVMIGSVGSETLPGDLQGQRPSQAESAPLQPLPPALATTDVRVESQFLGLQLAARLAADAYRNFEAETAKIWVAAVGNAHDYGAQVVDPATTADPDTAAGRWRVVWAATLALVLGAGIAFAREYSRRTVHPAPRTPSWAPEPAASGAVTVGSE
jgi:capsular polysaccharide biosynthesis protein